jgi:hypothetical protein
LAKKVEEVKKKAQEHIEFCTNEAGFDKEQAKKLVFGDFTIRDSKAQVTYKSKKK